MSMAPKTSNLSNLEIPAKTNFMGIMNVNNATDRCKCFVHWMNTSYLHGTLAAQPTVYIVVLEQFQRTATRVEIGLENGTSKTTISCIRYQECVHCF